MVNTPAKYNIFFIMGWKGILDPFNWKSLCNMDFSPLCYDCDTESPRRIRWIINLFLINYQVRSIGKTLWNNAKVFCPRCDCNKPSRCYILCITVLKFSGHCFCKTRKKLVLRAPLHVVIGYIIVPDLISSNQNNSDQNPYFFSIVNISSAFHALGCDFLLSFM